MLLLFDQRIGLKIDSDCLVVVLMDAVDITVVGNAGDFITFSSGNDAV